MRLADLLPGLARWSVLAMTGNPNELVDVGLFFLLSVVFLTGRFLFQGLLAMREVQCLSAIVFARFEEKFQ
jgi:peroxin-3